MAKVNESAVEEIQRKLTEQGEEYIELFVPLNGPGEQPPLYVEVNGENAYMQRGESVKIKRKFGEIIKHAEEQERAAREAKRRAREAAKKPFAQL